jgi:hypothetical protein
VKTATFQDVFDAAAELAKRTRDQIPVQEKVSLQGFLATEFEGLFTLRAWPELIPPVLNVMAPGGQFSKNEGAANEIGEVLDVMLGNPQSGMRCQPRHVGFYEGDGVVWLDRHCGSVWVEYMQAYPSVTWPDLALMAPAAFLAAVLPRRWRQYLAHKAAARLLDTDDASLAGAAMKQEQLAQAALVDAINRLPPEPRWRNTMRMSSRDGR